MRSRGRQGLAIDRCRRSCREAGLLARVRISPVAAWFGALQKRHAARESGLSQGSWDFRGGEGLRVGGTVSALPVAVSGFISVDGVSRKRSLQTREDRSQTLADFPVLFVLASRLTPPKSV